MQNNPNISPLMNNRWSPRAFDPEKLVPKEQLENLLQAASWAPSSGNGQPWHFIVGHNFDKCHEAVLSTLGPGNQIWAKNAPILMITVAKLSRNDRPNRHAFHDVGMATENMILQALDQNLYCHIMGGFSADKAREVFNIPEDYEAVSAVSIGYMGDKNSLPDDLKEREGTNRERRPLADFVFTEKWGNPISW